MGAVKALPANASHELGRILSGQLIRSVYQPLVDLDSGTVVGYEALARGPVGSLLEAPDALFAVARATRQVVELDRQCRQAALAGATAAGLRNPLMLFVNVEPAGIARWQNDVFDHVEDLQVVLEITERDLMAAPADLMALVDRVRAQGWGVALDDVGADPASLALLPLLRPDVIKLDLRLVQARPDGDIAAIVNAVSAESERAGTVVLAEGIETSEHRQTALALGATLGQGWLFGRPGPIPTEPPGPAVQPVRVAAACRWPGGSPFQLVAARRPVRRSDKGLLVGMSKQLELQAHDAGGSSVVLSTFQHRRHFTPATSRRYTQIAQAAALVAVFGEDMPAALQPGVRGGPLQAGDMLLGEWDIAILGPHFAAALVANDLGDDGPENQRRFDYALTHERDLVIRVAQSLMSRIRG
jgi:EAL domain-containing protein (putative c-di-GMP-specific phosphodiesterase class I)